MSALATQHTIMTICKFDGLQNKFFALKNMGILPYSLQDVDGLQFKKLLGSGSLNGFSIWPDFSRYALLTVWKDCHQSEKFFTSNEVIKAYLSKCVAYQHVHLSPTMAHGMWDGKMPFEIGTTYSNNETIAVLTRATIRWRDMIRFWKDVPSVSRSLEGNKHCLFAAGIGEMPFRYQATFSIWNDGEAMKKFAYSQRAHKNMIEKTRKVGWYSEELFARFKVLKTEGDLFKVNI
jgi:heme-degrading monooxygenase HmoA